ncbi:alpha/beta hydrolase [Pendulispora rubella]|uniref:Alpha/beta hydrolase n=1 Tax=Pendulispora rubella TaxID=2741070 RepID=A0ABZ2L6B5_9BACT
MKTNTPILSLASLATMVLLSACVAADGGAAGGDEARLAVRGDVRSALRPASDIAWTPCGTIGGECATIRVPVDWAHPQGETFELAIGRLLALDPENRIGTLFLNPGGPGGSGIDSFILNNKIFANSALRKRFDLVSWDPRGVGRSQAIVCSTELVKQVPWSYPRTQAEYDELVALNRKLGEDCRARSGPVFDHVDTLSTVRDMDAIRAGLGEEQLSYYGVSYGTQIGQQYAEEFPERIRAMVLDSNIDHSITSDFRYLQTNTNDLETSFRAFADWCERAPACKLYGRDVVSVWDSLYQKALAGTLINPTTGELVSVEGLRGVLHNGMYNLGGRLLKAAERLWSLDTGTPGTLPSPPPLPPEEEAVTPYAYQTILCQDWKFPTRSFRELDAYRHALEVMYPHAQMTLLWGDIPGCYGFPVKANNPQRRLSAPDAPPILMLTARHDIATPYDWNITAHRQLETSVLLHHDGIGHRQYGRPCVTEHVEQYLTTLVTPPRNTHCAADWGSAAFDASVDDLSLPSIRSPRFRD